MLEAQRKDASRVAEIMLEHGFAFAFSDSSLQFAVCTLQFADFRLQTPDFNFNFNE
jgi:hypothetical protein